ncbi:MAG: DUF362 domain-containing protein [Pseudomonadota bacterium]
MNNLVGLLKCSEYKLDLILEKFQKLLELIQFDTNGVRGKTVLLKPNMLGAYPPEMGITTNPIFVEAAIVLFKELGAKLWLGDSPNGIFPIEEVWEKTGMHALCKKYQVEEKPFERSGSINRQGIQIAKPVLDAEILVSLPKLKTHGLTILTVATKNLYGCVPGLVKTTYHKKFLDHFSFSRHLVKIAQLAKPSLHLVDAIVGMQGNGPSAGDLIKLNVILAGQDHHLIDEACCQLVGLNPEHLDTLIAARNFKLWKTSNSLKIVGDNLEDCKPKSFILPKTYTKGWRDLWISKFVIEQIMCKVSIKPKIIKDVCVHCGLCVKSCPVQAITQKDENSVPKISNKKCIECYCCHEICPSKAIDLNESFFIKLWRYFSEHRIKKLTEEK